MQENNELVFDKWWLRFKNKETANRYSHWCLHHDFSLVRLMLAFGMFVTITFLIIDAFRNTNFQLVFLIRSSIFILLCIVFVLTYSRWVKKHERYQIVAFLLVLFLIISVLLIDFFGNMPEFFLINATVTILLLSCSITGIRFVNYIIFSALVVGIYMFYSGTYFEIDRQNQTIFLISFIIGCIVICYVLERNKIELFIRETLQEEAHHKIVESNALKDKLLSIISHDVKAPMNSLKGLLHLYNNNALKESEFRKISSDMESSLDQSTELLDNLLRWSNMQLNDQMIQLKPIHLKKLIEDNIKPFLASVSHKKLKINIDIADINQDIISDEQSIGVAFRNVFSNAIKYSNAGESIDIYAHRDGEMITLQICNAGEPINAEEQEKIFTYQAVSKEGTFQEIGTGLGLNLAFNLLSKIGGNLTYNYGKDHLSCFIITFPFNAAENNAG